MIALTEKEKEELKKLAYQSIESFLKKKEIPEIKLKENEKFSKKFGVFVTLKKQNQLRGCIGFVEPIYPLKKAIVYAALQAAFNDPRFLPLEEEELKEISIEISILGDLKKVKDLKEIKLGEDGVLIKQGIFQALFLPQVAKETGWSLEEFLGHLCLKAGLDYFCFKDPKTEIYRFPALVF